MSQTLPRLPTAEDLKGSTGSSRDSATSIEAYSNYHQQQGSESFQCHTQQQSGRKEGLNITAVSDQVATSTALPTISHHQHRLRLLRCNKVSGWMASMQVPLKTEWTHSATFKWSSADSTSQAKIKTECYVYDTMNLWSPHNYLRLHCFCV